MAIPAEKSSCGSPACDLRIEELIHRDPVTGLANRAQLQVDLEQAWDEARRAGRQIALLSIDLDDFKRVNDRHGQAVGDALLHAVADRLRTIVRPADLLARQGGDEFLLLVRDIPAGASRVATDMAGRVLGMLRAPFEIEDVVLSGERQRRRQHLSARRAQRRRAAAARRSRDVRRQGRRQGRLARPSRS